MPDPTPPRPSRAAFLSFTLPLTAAFAAGLGAAPAEWPQWRGPRGEGHAPAAGSLPTEWGEGRNVAWKTALPHRGHSSPVIDGDQVWLTAAAETPADPEDAKRRLRANTGSQPLTLVEKVVLRALCVDRGSGEILCDIPLMERSKPQWVHRLNSYASPSPVIEAGRLYGHFGAFGTACVDTHSGKVLWTNDELEVMHENGPGSSPVLWRDLLILTLDGSDEQFVAALDKGTGKVVWKVERSGEMHSNPQLKKTCATPLIVGFDGGGEVLLSNAANWVYAYDPATGQELWKLAYGGLGFSNVARPVTGHGLIYICTGFMRSEVIAVRPPASNAGKGAPAEIVWRYSKSVPKTPSPLLVGDELYFVSDNGGVFTCIDAHTGKEHYKKRVGGQTHSASPTFADGKIFLHSHEGITSVLAPGKEFKLLAENRLDGAHMATAAAAGGALFLRTDAALYRIEEQRN